MSGIYMTFIESCDLCSYIIYYINFCAFTDHCYPITCLSKPDIVTMMAFSNSSIFLTLGRPVDMRVTQYNFNIMYKTARSSDVSLSESTESTAIQDLPAGTNFTNTVTAVVLCGVNSVDLNQFYKYMEWNFLPID